MLAPTIARGVATDASYQMQNVLPTWSQKAEELAKQSDYEPTGLAVSFLEYNQGYDTKGGYPLGQAMSFVGRSGYLKDDYKPFVNRYAYCVASHVANYLVYDGMQVFFKKKYNTVEMPNFVQGTSEENRQFNFLMLAIACGYPTSYELGDSSIPYNLICQTIAWTITNNVGEFTGAPKDLQEGSIKNYFMADLNKFHASLEYQRLRASFSASAAPETDKFFNSAPPANSSAAKNMGLTNTLDATFYDIWMAAYLTNKLTPNWQTYITETYTTAERGADGYYHAYVPLFQCQEAEIYLQGMTPTMLGDWEFVGNEASPSGNGTMVQHFKSPTGETVNGEICTLSWKDTDTIGAMMPIDQTKAKLYVFTFFNAIAANPNVWMFDNAQDRFSSVIDQGLSVHVKLGENPVGDQDTEVKRHEHEETWNANYNVNLYKFDSETGKPLADSRWDILERFDASQLDNTDLDRKPDDPGVYTSNIGTLNETEWGDDTVEDNYNGDMGVTVSDTNKYNWGNDNDTQFETWDDEHDDPCDRDENVTGEDGKLREIDSNGNASDTIAHTDTKHYTYHKGYCDGHPAPTIEYIKCDHDPDENCDCEEQNQKLHDDAWAAWYQEVETCEKLVEEGGFFHCISTDGAAKKAMEEDRDQFYKDFISLTYEYSAEEIMAPKGYILHGTHTDDIPIEWRNVTSSEYKDTEQATALEHNGASSTDTDAGNDDGDEDAEAENLFVVSATKAIDTEDTVSGDVTDDTSVKEETSIAETDDETTVATASDMMPVEIKDVVSDVDKTLVEDTSNGFGNNVLTSDETVENDTDKSVVDSETETADEISENSEVLNENDTVSVVENKIIRRNRKASPSELSSEEDVEYEDDDTADEDILDDEEELATPSDALPEHELRHTGFIDTVIKKVSDLWSDITSYFATMAVSDTDDETGDDEGGNGTGSYLRNTITFLATEANSIKAALDDIIDWTFIVYDHRTEGEIHFNKRDFDLNNDTSDAYDDYADENADGTLEGAVYGLFAAQDIIHPDTDNETGDASDGDTGVVFKKDDLVAVATTDRNGDGSFMTITEAPGTHYDYETGTTVTTDWYENAPKNLHIPENDSAAKEEDIESFEGHNPDNSEITAGNGGDLPDTETGDATYHWKKSTNQNYDSGMLENNHVSNRKEDTWREADTSGHYPISNNEDNNGNCWIGRPLILGKDGSSYYIKELSRSEGYELSVYGSDQTLTTNRDAFDAGGDEFTSGQAKATDITYDQANGGNTFSVTSSGTQNGYILKVSNIPEGATFNITTTSTYMDENKTHPEIQYVPVETDAIPGNYVYLGGSKIEAQLGDTVTYGGKSFTVNNVKVIDNSKTSVKPDNRTYIENPALDITKIQGNETTNVMKDVNTLFSKSGFRKVVNGCPWVSVQVDEMTDASVAEAVNEQIFEDPYYSVFNAMEMLGSYTSGGKTYVAIGYCYRDVTTNNALYNEKNDQIYVKTDLTYKTGNGTLEGFAYRTYNAADCESVVTNENGFVTSAVVPNETASGSLLYAMENMSGKVSFTVRANESYWTYAEGEKLLTSEGEIAVHYESKIVDVKPSKVTEVKNEKLTDVTYHETKQGAGTYTVTISQDLIDKADNGTIDFRILYSDDTATIDGTQIGCVTYAQAYGIVGITYPYGTADSYIRTVMLMYPGQNEIYSDGDTIETPISVTERPIRQQVKISKDVQTLPTTMKVWYCANDGVANSDDVDTCAGCGRKRTVEATKSIDYAHDTYTAFFNEDLSDKKQETNWITRLKNWFATISGVSGSEDTAKAVANFRFKAYLKSNIERLYRDENGKVTFEDRNGNEVTPNYVDTNGDGLYETFTWNTYNGTSDFPEKDKTEDGKILSTNVQKVFTKVEHPTTSYTTSAVANNVWDTYSTPENGADDNVAERNNGATTNQRVKANRSDDAVKTNLSLYSYQNDATNVQKNDWLRDNQNKGYTRILESTERVIEDGTSTRTVQTYNYEKFFDAIAAANTDKWDDDIATCTFNYDGYDTPVGKISMQNYPGQKWENTLKEENQKGDVNNSFDLFRWIHEKIYGSVADYQKFQDGQGNYGTLSGTNTETTTSTSDYARANAEASNAVRQFAVKWYMKDEVAKLVKNNGVGDGEDIAKTEAEGGAPGITEEGVVPYDDYIHDYALFKALQKAYNYLRPFYENDLDTIYSVEWDSAKDGGNDKDVTTLSTDIHEEGAFYNTSSYLPYGVYVIVEQTPSNFSADTGYDLVNRAFNIEKPKEVIVPSLYEGNASDNTTDNYDTHYSFDPALSPDKLAASKYNGGSGYLIRFNEEWPTAENDFDDNHSANGTAEHVIRAHGYYGDFEVFKYGLDVDKNGKEANRAISNNGGYDFRGFTIAQSIFDPLKDYYSVGHNGESKDDAMIKITAAEGGEGDNGVRYPLADLARNNEQTANGTAKYDIDTLINRFYYASVSEDNGRASDVIYKGGAKNDNNASGMQFKDNVKTVTGELTAYEGKFAQMLVPWTVTAPADINTYSNTDFTGYADVNERDTFKTATLTIRKVDAETGEQIIHDDTVFGIYAASRYTTENEILADAEKLTGAEKTKFINQFKPGDTKFYMEDTKVYASKEFLEAMGAYDISYLVSLDKGKAKRYGENGYKRVTEADIKKILGADGYNKITGTVEYGVYHLDVMSGTSIPDDEEVTWYYSVYNTDSPLCVGTIPKGTPICSEKNAVILQDNFTVNKDENDETRTGMLKAYSSLNDVLMEDEDKAGTTSYHLQNTGYIRTPQPLGSGCYVVAELKTPSGYLRGKPEAHEIYSGVDYYYEGGDMFKKAAMVDYQKRIDLNYSYAK